MKNHSKDLLITILVGSLKILIITLVVATLLAMVILVDSIWVDALVICISIYTSAFYIVRTLEAQTMVKDK